MPLRAPAFSKRPANSCPFSGVNRGIGGWPESCGAIGEATGEARAGGAFAAASNRGNGPATVILALLQTSLGVLLTLRCKLSSGLTSRLTVANQAEGYAEAWRCKKAIVFRVCNLPDLLS